MGGNSVYVDPDTISRVSSQMSRCADEIESLRSSIVPQVYEVVDRGLGVHLSLDGGSALGATHDSIVYFNHEAQIITQDLRISAQGLQKVAEEARRIEQELLQQATMFSTAGQGGSRSGSGKTNSSWWQHLSGTVNTVVGTVTTALTPFDEEFLKGLEGIPPEKLRAFEQFIKVNPGLQNVLRLLNSTRGVGTVAVFGILSDYASGAPVNGGSGKDYSPRAFLSKAIGGGLGTAAIFTGVGTIATVAMGVINLGGSWMASGQNWLGNTYGGAIGNQLKGPVQGLQQASNDANMTRFWDSMGQDVVDRAGNPLYAATDPQLLAPIAMLNGVAGMFGVPISRPEDVPSDDGRVLSNGWHLIRSVPEFVVNAQATVYDDGIALENKWIQNLPLPSQLNGIKDFSNAATGGLIGLVNGGANLITKMWSWG